MNPPVILVATVQHTGTWFILHALASSPRVAGWTFQRKLRSGQDRPVLDGRSMVLHSHFGDETCKDLIAHFNELEFWTHALPTIVMLRDPMLAVISRQSRHPEIASNAYIVDGFARIAALKTAVHFVNIDLPERGRAQVTSIFEQLELGPPRAQILRDWPRKNSTVGNPLKQAYKAGNMKAVAAAVPKSWQRLMEKKHVIRPFLERNGYPSLPWY